MKMEAFYVAYTDERGVFCVEEVVEYDDTITEMDVARMAKSSTGDAIYFGVEAPPTSTEILRQAIVSLAETEGKRWQDTSGEARAVIEAWNTFMLAVPDMQIAGYM